MSPLIALVGMSLGFAGGPLTVEGTSISAKDLVATGSASVQATTLQVSGGRLTLKPAVQKSLDGKLAGQPLTVVVQLKDASAGPTTALTVGALKLSKKADGWYVSAGAASLNLGKATGGSLRAVLSANSGSLQAFRDGRSVGFANYGDAKVGPLVIGSPATEKTPWKGTIVDLEILPRSLMPQEAASMSGAAVEADGKTATVEAVLMDFTEVPSPQSVLPYRDALVTHQYKVVTVTAGGIKGVTAGAVIRVARWGIRSSQKTAIADLKKGAKVTLSLGRFQERPDLERQFTVDKLPDNFDVPYLLDLGN